MPKEIVGEVNAGFRDFPPLEEHGNNGGDGNKKESSTMETE